MTDIKAEIPTNLQVDEIGSVIVLCEQLKELPEVDEKGRFIVRINDERFYCKCAKTDDEKKRAFRVEYNK